MKQDFTALWNTRRFDDIRVETGKGDRGGIIVTFIIKGAAVIGLVTVLPTCARKAH